jgi:hypothetical protein
MVFLVTGLVLALGIAIGLAQAVAPFLILIFGIAAVLLFAGFFVGASRRSTRAPD